MSSRRRYRAAVLAAVVGSAATLYGMAPARGQATARRLAGTDRDSTAVAVSQAAYPGAGSADAAVVASSVDFADAVAAAPLAARRRAPLLLTAAAQLDPAVGAELQRVLPAGATVYVLGGPAALSDQVLSEISALGFQPTRLAGADRYSTAVAIADQLGDPGTVLLATGLSYPDALAAGAAAASVGGAVLLTAGSSLPAPTDGYLRSHPGTRYAVGGPAAAADPSATGLVGSDRYATASAVAGRFFPGPAVAGFASGATYADALAGGAQLAASGGPLLLVPAAGAVPTSVGGYVANTYRTISAAWLYGGTSAVGSGVEQQIDQLLAGSAPTAPSQSWTDSTDPTAIPLGDGKLSVSPRVGYVDSCAQSFNGGGAQGTGPWVNTAQGTWNATTKVAVQGSHTWPSASYQMSVSGATRTITGNGLPVGAPTGTFPIAPSDPAYQYDRNPNSISPQNVDYALPADPSAAPAPACVGLGPIGIAVDGVALFDALDAEGRDAGAHEVQDSCQGHPENTGQYHYHSVSTCLLQAQPDTSQLVGYALDGYGIYAEWNAAGHLPTDADLDACHGRSSPVVWDGATVTMYHYDVTIEYPYSLGCYHGTPIETAHPG